jgi:hypothetical protein
MTIKRESREHNRSQRGTPEHTMSEAQDAAIRAVHARFLKIAPATRPLERPMNVSTRSLYLSDASGTLTKHDGKTGSAMGSLYAWGFLQKISTHAPQCCILPKGWAYLIAVGAAVIDDVPTPHVELVNTLLPAMREQYDGKPILDPDAFLAQDDGPTAEEVEALLLKRLEDPEQTTLALSALIKAWPDVDAKSISDNLTPLEILKADLATTQQGPDNYWKRELGVRLSTRYEGDLYSTDRHGPKVGAPGSLAEHLSPASVIEHEGLHGKDRIAAGLQMHEDRLAGIARNMPPEATLGDVWKRLDNESAMSERFLAAETTPENIAAAKEAAEAEDAGLPIVDWIDKHMGAIQYDGMVELDRAKLVARGAVLRSVRERITRYDDQSGAPRDIPGEVIFTGGALQIRHEVEFNGRPANVVLTIDSDYDEADTQNVRNWFKTFVERGMWADTRTGRSYHFPPYSDAELSRIGDAETLKVRGGINLVWAGVIGMLGGMLGGIAGTGALMFVLSFFIR